MVEKFFWGSTLIKKRRYWPKVVTAEEILQHMQNKEFGYVEEVKGSIRGRAIKLWLYRSPTM